MQQYNNTMEKTTTACHGGGGGGGCDDPDPFLLLLLHLPEEVLIQILERLPVVSLLRFKSVCKSWHALIQSSFFIDLHTTFNSSSSSKFGTFILRTVKENVILMLSEYEGSKSEYGDWYRCTDGSWHKFTTDRDWHWDDTNRRWYGFDRRDDDDKDDQEVFKADDDDDRLLLKVDNLELPSWLTYGKFIAGSCNGLICLHDQKLRDVSLWNPATRQFRILPKSITIEIDDDDVQHCGDFVAFGFDVKTKDYKVLLITKYFTPYVVGGGRNYSCRVQVYSLSTDSWRLFEGINSPLALPDENHHGLYMNGSCFFVASVYHPESHTYNRFINSFDFTKEIFTTMLQLPDHDNDHRQQYLYLRCLGGGEKMALFSTRRNTSYDEYMSDDEYGYEDYDIWVLNEHDGVNKESSWTKLHSFQIENSIRGLPIGISNNGKFAFLEITTGSYRKRRRRIQLYNLVTKEVKLDIPFCVRKSKVYVYKPSLISVNGGNGTATSPGSSDEVIGGGA